MDIILEKVLRENSKIMFEKVDCKKVNAGKISLTTSKSTIDINISKFMKSAEQ